MPSMPTIDASHLTLKSFSKQGKAYTGAQVRLSLISSNAIWALGLHLNEVPLITSVIGAIIALKFFMNYL